MIPGCIIAFRQPAGDRPLESEPARQDLRRVRPLAARFEPFPGRPGSLRLAIARLTDVPEGRPLPVTIEDGETNPVGDRPLRAEPLVAEVVRDRSGFATPKVRSSSAIGSALSGRTGSRTTSSNSLPIRSPKSTGRPARPSASISAPSNSGSVFSPYLIENSCVVTACLSFVPAHETRSRLTPRLFESADAKSFVSHSRSVARNTRCG